VAARTRNDARVARADDHQRRHVGVRRVRGIERHDVYLLIHAADRTADPRTAAERINGALDRVGLLAAAGKLDPVIGRDNEIRRVMQVLGRRSKNNPIVIGDPGVGKTAVVEGLAQRMAAGDVPAELQGKLRAAGAVGAIQKTGDDRRFLEDFERLAARLRG